MLWEGERPHPALYEAILTLPTGLRSAKPEAEPELRKAFEVLAAMVEAPDTTLATETFWAALHGLAALERSGRIRQGARDERVALVVRGRLGC